MSRSRRRIRSRSRGRARRSRYNDGEDVNPMNFVSNLSDVMLILAVGIMLALILHWNLEINTTENAEGNQSEQESVVSFEDSELEEQETLPEDMERKGEVYYDAASGKYYIVEDSNTDD